MGKYEVFDFYSNKNQIELIKNLKSELIFGDLNSPVPKYTILIPTYRRVDLLEEAVRSALKQKNIKNYEIIVVEHGHENDATEKMLEKYKKHKNLFYYKLEKWTPGGNWNKGSELVRTEWFTLLCDDDLLYPEYLFTIDTILKKYPHIEGIVAKSKAVYYDLQNKKTIPAPNEETTLFAKFLKLISFFKKVLSGSKSYIGDFLPDNCYALNMIPIPLGAMYKKENFMSLGAWNIDCGLAADCLMHLNYMINYNFYYTTEILTGRREWKGNGSRDKSVKIESILFLQDFYKTLKPYLKIIKYDQRYNDLMKHFYLNELKIKLEDMKEFDFDISEERQNEGALVEFKNKRDAYIKQLAKYNPATIEYHYNSLLRKFIFKEEVTNMGINEYNDIAGYCADKNIQKQLNRIQKKYRNKKIVLYGAGTFADNILKNIDFSNLNIQAIADLSYETTSEFHGYKVIDPNKLKDMDFDVLLIFVQRNFIVKNFLKKTLFKDFKPIFKIDSFMGMSWKERIKLHFASFVNS